MSRDLVGDRSSPQRASWSLGAYGLRIDSSFPLPGFILRDRASPSADVSIDVCEPEVAPTWNPGEGQIVWRTRLQDGVTFEVQVGGSGDHHFTYGERATYHLSPDGTHLLCRTRAPTMPDWKRVLLDTVLFSIALIMGSEALHASAIERGGAVLAIASASGGGKTSLAAEFLLRGCSLFADDIVVLRKERGEIIANPGPPLMNLPDGLVRTLGEHARTLARFPAEREHWALVSPAARRPAPLSAVCLLERGRKEATSLTTVEPHPLTLLPHAVFYPHLRQRSEGRFSLHADLADKIPVHRVQTNLATSASMIADRIEGVMDGRQS